MFPLFLLFISSFYFLCRPTYKNKDQEQLEGYESFILEYTCYSVYERMLYRSNETLFCQTGVFCETFTHNARHGHQQSNDNSATLKHVLRTRNYVAGNSVFWYCYYAAYGMLPELFHVYLLSRFGKR